MLSITDKPVILFCKMCPTMGPLPSALLICGRNQIFEESITNFIDDWLPFKWASEPEIGKKMFEWSQDEVPKNSQYRHKLQHLRLTVTSKWLLCYFVVWRRRFLTVPMWYAIDQQQWNISKRPRERLLRTAHWAVSWHLMSSLLWPILGHILPSPTPITDREDWPETICIFAGQRLGAIWGQELCYHS